MRYLWLLGLLLLTLAPARAGHTPPKILLRIYVQTPGEGLPSTQAIQIPIPPDNEMIQIRALPEITERELVDVQVGSSGNVQLFFNHTGTVDLNAVTAQNQGRILVVVINGVVVYAPIIDQQIENGELVMSHSLPPLVISLLQQVARENVRQAAKT